MTKRLFLNNIDMANKCKNCGKFVAKNTTTCKHCGQENPAVLEDNNLPTGLKGQARPVNVNIPKQIQCPYCGSLLSLSKQFENDDTFVAISAI